MREISPADENQNDIDMRWHIDVVHEAVKDKDLAKVLTELKRAWWSGYDVTHSQLMIRDDINFFKENLYSIVRDFISEEVEQGKLSVDDRIRYFRFVYPYDYWLARAFIEHINTEEEYSFGDDELNHPDLEMLVFEYYEWLIDNNKDVNLLHDALEADGHLDNFARVKLDRRLKNKIIEYVKRRMESLDDPGIDEEEQENASDILLALDSDDE